MLDQNQHLHVTRTPVPSIQISSLITPCFSKQDQYRQNTFANHHSRSNEHLPMVAGSVHTELLPDDVKNLAAYLNSTKPGQTNRHMSLGN